MSSPDILGRNNHLDSRRSVASDVPKSGPDRLSPVDHKDSLETQTKMQGLSAHVHLKHNNFLRTGNINELDESIATQSLIVQRLNVEDKQYWASLDKLGVLFETRYNRLGRAQDLESAIENADLAVQVISKDQTSVRAEALHNLGVRYAKRHTRLGRISDLESAITKVEQAILNVSPADHSVLRVFSSNLAEMLRKRYERTGRIQDLESAIKKAEWVLETTPEDAPDRASHVGRIGTMLLRRYQCTRQLQDLESAIEKTTRAIQLTSMDHPSLAIYLSVLAYELEERYTCMGNTQDLDLAIEKEEQSVQITPTDHPNFAMYTSNLANKLMTRYERTGRIQDLQDSIVKADRAVQVTPIDHPDSAMYLSNLANKLKSRYERIGLLQDLETAIEKAEQAVRATPKDDTSFPMYSNNLANKLMRRYERTSRIEDLDAAIENADQAAQNTPINHSEFAKYSSNLAYDLSERYRNTGRVQDLEEAVKRAEQAVRVTSAGHMDLAGYLNKLGVLFVRQYNRTGLAQDLQTAIDRMEQAVKATPSDHPDRAIFLNNLGNYLLLSPNEHQNAKALPSFLRAWEECRSSVPFQRLRSATNLVRLLVKDKNWSKAANVAVDAVWLLPSMNQRVLDRDDQQNLLSMFAGLAATAGSLLLQTGHSAGESAEILELGRGAILGIMIDDRRDISHLRRVCPQEADKYDILRMELNSDPVETMTRTFNGKNVSDRTRTVQEFEACIERIRTHPGLERFLLGLSVTEIQRQASDGHIIIVNVTDIRSDAVVVKENCTSVIPLPDFSAEKLQSWKRKKLTQFQMGTFGKKNKDYIGFLSFIWKSCVQVILANILENFHASSAAVKPRSHVWWIGAGDAADIPFHAAGDHNPNSTDNTCSHVISSYTPTVKALQFSRERQSQAGHGHNVPTPGLQHRRLCMVTMPQTPGHAELPGVLNESSCVEKAVNSSSVSITQLTSPTVTRVKEELRTCHIFHFAGHGIVNFVNPSRSALVLQKQDVDRASQVQDHLSVADISRLNLRHAQLAYLSACSTAGNSTPLLADEVIHLASGFQVAGFAQVIGAMWPAEDEVCVEIVRLFYGRLRRDLDLQVATRGTTAEFLHSAVMEVRKRHWQHPLMWAQYVHYGA